MATPDVRQVLEVILGINRSCGNTHQRATSCSGRTGCVAAWNRESRHNFPAKKFPRGQHDAGNARAVSASCGNRFESAEAACVQKPAAHVAVCCFGCFAAGCMSAMGRILGGQVCAGGSSQKCDGAAASLWNCAAKQISFIHFFYEQRVLCWKSRKSLIKITFIYCLTGRQGATLSILKDYNSSIGLKVSTYISGLNGKTLRHQITSFRPVSHR